MLALLGGYWASAGEMMATSSMFMYRSGRHVDPCSPRHEILGFGRRFALSIGLGLSTGLMPDQLYEGTLYSPNKSLQNPNKTVQGALNSKP